MKKIIILTLGVFIVLSGYSFASYTHEEIDEMVRKKELPELCSYAGVGRKEKTPMGRMYREMYGQDWIHMHHYCWALAQSQTGNIKGAIGNLNYVLRGIREDSKLRPMVLRQKAHVLVLEGMDAEAIPVFYSLINQDPSSEEGYLGLANIFLKSGDKATAKIIIDQGLVYVPKSEKLLDLRKNIEQ